MFIEATLVCNTVCFRGVGSHLYKYFYTMPTTKALLIFYHSSSLPICFLLLSSSGSLSSVDRIQGFILICFVYAVFLYTLQTKSTGYCLFLDNLFMTSWPPLWPVLGCLSVLTEWQIQLWELPYLDLASLYLGWNPF